MYTHVMIINEMATTLKMKGGGKPLMNYCSAEHAYLQNVFPKNGKSLFNISCWQLPAESELVKLLLL